MDKYSKRGLNIFYGMCGLLVIIGLIMELTGETANGIVGAGRTSPGKFASLQGWQISLLGAFLFLLFWISMKIGSK